MGGSAIGNLDEGRAVPQKVAIGDAEGATLVNAMRLDHLEKLANLHKKGRSHREVQRDKTTLL